MDYYDIIRKEDAKKNEYSQRIVNLENDKRYRNVAKPRPHWWEYSAERRERIQKENIEYLEKLTDEVGLPDDLTEEFKILFILVYKKKLTIGREFEITRWAILITLLQVRYFYLFKEWSNSLDDKKKFEEISSNIEDIALILDKLIDKDLKKYDKAIETIHNYFKDKILDILSKKYKDISSKTPLFIFRTRQIDNRAHYLENSFEPLFKETNHWAMKRVSVETKENKDGYFKSVKDRAMKLAYAYLKGIIFKEGKPKKRRGLICACCYYIANKNFQEGYWLKPEAQEKWRNFFSIDSKNTFKERLRKLEKFDEINDINSIIDDVDSFLYSIRL